MPEKHVEEIYVGCDFGALIDCPHCGTFSTLRKDEAGIFYLEKIVEQMTEKEEMKIRKDARKFAKEAKKGLRDLIVETKNKRCLSCHGSGIINNRFGFIRMRPSIMACPICKGKGVIRE